MTLPFHVLIQTPAIDPHSFTDLGSSDVARANELPECRAPQSGVPFGFGVSQPGWLHLLRRTSLHYRSMFASLCIPVYHTSAQGTQKQCHKRVSCRRQKSQKT